MASRIGWKQYRLSASMGKRTMATTLIATPILNESGSTIRRHLTNADHDIKNVHAFTTFVNPSDGHQSTLLMARLVSKQRMMTISTARVLGERPRAGNATTRIYFADSCRQLIELAEQYELLPKAILTELLQCTTGED